MDKQIFDEHMLWFSMLSNALSPENLYCDGEISHAAAKKKYRKLKAEWKELEKSFGRKVDENEVWKWESKRK
jgi:hypothetical protein